MKLALILVFLVSCASNQKCVETERKEFFGTTVVEYECPDSKKYCKYDQNGMKINCFVAKKWEKR